MNQEASVKLPTALHADRRLATARLAPPTPPAQNAAAQTHLSGFEQYVCGVVGGLGKVVTGHPFDTIKARVQSGAYPTARQALVQTIRGEGAKALYQGVLPPCISVGCVSGILFFANGRIRSALQPDASKPLTYSQMAVAGGGAGAVTALVLTPLDQIKLWMQIERRAAATASVTMADAAPLTYWGHLQKTGRQIGTPQLYRGFAATTLREIGTFGIFFPMNEFLKAVLAKGQSDPQQPLPLHLRILAAGTSGVLCWIPCYPIDQIKTRQQLQGHPLLETATPASGSAVHLRQRVPAWSGKSMWVVGAQILRVEGVHGFSRGIVPCLLRAFPTYTAQFLIFDSLTASLRQRHQRVAPPS